MNTLARLQFHNKNPKGTRAHSARSNKALAAIDFGKQLPRPSRPAEVVKLIMAVKAIARKARTGRMANCNCNSRQISTDEGAKSKNGSCQTAERHTATKKGLCKSSSKPTNQVEKRTEKIRSREATGENAMTEDTKVTETKAIPPPRR